MLLGLTLLAAGCGGSLDPGDVPGEAAPRLETELDGLALPRGSERLRVVSDDAGRSIAQYLVPDREVGELLDFHTDTLTRGGWEESRRSTSGAEGDPVARLRFGREPWERSPGVDSLRYRLTVDLAQEGDDVLMTWSVLDQQAVGSPTVD